MRNIMGYITMSKTISLRATIGLVLVGFLMGVAATKGQYHLLPVIAAAAYICTDTFYN